MSGPPSSAGPVSTASPAQLPVFTSVLTGSCTSLNDNSIALVHGRSALAMADWFAQREGVRAGYCSPCRAQSIRLRRLGRTDSATLTTTHPEDIILACTTLGAQLKDQQVFDRTPVDLSIRVTP